MKVNARIVDANGTSFDNHGLNNYGLPLHRGTLGNKCMSKQIQVTPLEDRCVQLNYLSAAYLVQ